MFVGFSSKKLGFFHKLGIGVILTVHFSLLTPINVSSIPLLRIITTDKLCFYFSFSVFMYDALHKDKFFFRVPGLIIFLIILIFMAISTLIGEGNSFHSPWFLYSKQIGYCFFSIASIIILSSIEALKTYFRWCLCLTVILSLFCIMSLLGLSDILPSTNRGLDLAEIIQAQTHTTGFGEYSGYIRKGVLWFDANNFAYLLGPQILYLIYLFGNTKRGFKRTVLWFSLILLIYSMLSTISRGGLFSLFFGANFLFFCGIKNKFFALRKITILCLIVFGFLLMTSPVALDILKQRYEAAAAFLGWTNLSTQFSGLELSRFLVAERAFEEFLEKPSLGWGTGFSPGVIGYTGNHLGYLNEFVKYGIIGFTFQIWLLWIYVSKLKFATELSKDRNDKDYMIGYLIMSIVVFSLVSGVFRSIHIIGLSILPLAFYMACYDPARKDMKLGRKVIKRYW